MTQADPRDHALALAGLFQAVHLVQQIARHGTYDREPFEASVASVMRIDADSVADVFGGAACMTLGLDTLARQLDSRRGHQDAEITRYAASVMFLERRLAVRGDVLERLRAGIELTAARLEGGGIEHQDAVDELAETYVATVGEVGPRLRVSGERHLLEVPANAARIRTMLLAGVRATVLWRQLGGNRLRLLLGRARLVRSAQALAGEAALRET